MFFPEDDVNLVELYEGAWEPSLYSLAKCPRCGSGPEQKVNGVCKAPFPKPDGTPGLCFLKW